MIEPVVDRPSPAAALAALFTRIEREQMRGLPMLNPALAVEALGFRPWGEHWLGVLVTPWFMNLVLAPRVVASWAATPERAKRSHAFPAGRFEFIAAHGPVLGEYQSCSLFSPMFEFADQAAARATALAALEALFAGAAPAAEAAPAAAPLSKRDFLLGARARRP